MRGYAMAWRGESVMDEAFASCVDLGGEWSET